MLQDREALLEALVAEVRGIYGEGFVPLHRPVLEGNEKQYLGECVDSNFVSSAGGQVQAFEEQMAAFVGARYAVATVNGTAALHAALDVAGVRPGDEVVTQALTFVATCNAISYAGAEPVFVDVDADSMGLSADALHAFFERETRTGPEGCFNRRTGRRIAACVPMHTFGHPCRIEAIVATCQRRGVPVVEDAAESLGSYSGSRHTGTFGELGTLSFNGNKVMTTGGGGMIITDSKEAAERARHLTTTSKRPGTYEFIHDELGYNYRLPSINAALGCAQLERLPTMLRAKAQIAQRYARFFESTNIEFVSQREGVTANYWLNTLRLPSADDRDPVLTYLNDSGVMSRPIWRLMDSLPMYRACQADDLTNSRWLEQRLINIPSSVPFGVMDAQEGTSAG